jgi:hypothetical protein
VASRWFFKVSGRLVGPVSSPESAETVGSKKVTKDDLGRRENRGRRVRCRDMVGLLQAVKRLASKTAPPIRKTGHADAPGQAQAGLGARARRLKGEEDSGSCDSRGLHYGARASCAHVFGGLLFENA